MVLNDTNVVEFSLNYFLIQAIMSCGQDMWHNPCSTKGQNVLFHTFSLPFQSSALLSKHIHLKLKNKNSEKMPKSAL